MTNDAPAQASVEAMARVIYESTEEILRHNFWEGWSLLDFAKADARTRNVHHVMARAVLASLSDEAPVAWMWIHEDGTRSFVSDPDTKRIWEETMKRVLAPVYTRPSLSAVEVKRLEWVKDGSVWVAHGGFGQGYQIYTHGEGEAYRVMFSWSTKLWDLQAPTLDEAKAAAQADYESRIR